MANSSERMQDIVVIPPSIVVDSFVKSRVNEIASLERAIRSSNNAGASRVFQTLPRALRRRAASHDARRVPQRHRAKTISEIVPGKGPKKRKLRQLPVRKRNIMKKRTRSESLRRRQRSKIWLPTHLWHAKRMHMVERWGYRLAHRPTAKAFRASYRASSSGCLLNDVSYFRHILLKGTQQDLEKVLSLISDPVSISPSAKRYVIGARLANDIAIYEPGLFPLGLIGPVSIIWRPSLTPETTSHRQILIIHHPSITKQIASSVRGAISQARARIGIDYPALGTFELTGPIAGKALGSVLKGYDARAQRVLEQFNPSQIAPNTILGITANDPRISFPPKLRFKQNNKQPRPEFVPPSADIANNDAFWTSCVKGIKPRYTKKELDERRFEADATGSKISRIPSDDRVPILAYQHTLACGSLSVSSKEHKQLSGWTILVPLGFALPFFHSLSALSIAVGGLQAREQQHFETAHCYFPNDWPATHAQTLESRREGLMMRIDWTKKPPAKRDNYEKLGTKSPFEADWSEVLNGQANTDPTNVESKEENKREEIEDVEKKNSPNEEVQNQPWLLRGRLLNKICQFIQDQQQSTATDNNKATVTSTLQPQSSSSSIQQVQQELEKYNLDTKVECVLVPVRVIPVSKGTFEPLALIYGPRDQEHFDFLYESSSSSKSSLSLKRTYVASKLIDSSENSSDDDMQDILNGDNDEQEQDKLKSTKNCPLVGRLTTANYSLHRGHGFGIGAMSLHSVIKLLEKVKPKSGAGMPLGPVLVRNKNGHIARPAWVFLII